MRFLLAAFAATSAVVWARNVGAQSSVTRAHATVSAPCADEDAFWRRVGAYTTLVTKASPGEAAVTLALTVHPGDEHVTGSFRVQDEPDAQASYERSVTGKTCEEVVDALSFFVALTYDPDASLNPRPAVPPAPATPVTPQAPPAPRSRQDAVTSREPWTFALGAAAQLATMDGIPLGGVVFAHASRKFGMLEPAFRISLSAVTTRVESSNYSARFVWLAATPEVCPTQLASGMWSLAPCVGVALGASTATPSGVPDERTYARAWLAPRGLVRGAFVLSRRVSLEMSLGVEAPLVRQRYTFGPVFAYHFPTIIPFATLGASFPLD